MHTIRTMGGYVVGLAPAEGDAPFHTFPAETTEKGGSGWQARAKINVSNATYWISQRWGGRPNPNVTQVLPPPHCLYAHMYCTVYIHICIFLLCMYI